MTKAGARSFWALPLLGLICLSLSFYGFADNDQQSELKQLKQAIFALEKQLQSQRQEKDQLETQIEIIETDWSQLNQSIRQLKTKITAANKQLKKLKLEKERLQQRIDEQRSAIAEQIRSAHKIGSQEPLKLLLNQQDPQQLARTLKYYDYLLQARSEKIKQFTNDVNQLELTVADIETTKVDLAKSQKSLQQDQKKLAQQAEKRRKTLKVLNKSLSIGNNKLGAYQKQRKQLESVIKNVKQAAKKIAPAKDYPPFIARKGKLSWPVKGKLQQAFGTLRGGDLHWEGWLISAESGTEIRAIYHGRVVFSNYLRGFGLLVIIDHGAGYLSLYAHNQELMTEVGDWIESGDAIARAGNTGGLTDPALYFELREKGIPIDPKNWLK